MVPLDTHIPSVAELANYPGWWIPIATTLAFVLASAFGNKLRRVFFTYGVVFWSCTVVYASYQVYHFTYKMEPTTDRHMQVVYWSMLLTLTASILVWMRSVLRSERRIERIFLNIGTALALLVLVASIGLMNGLSDRLTLAGLCAIFLGILSAFMHEVILRRWRAYKVRRRYPDGLDTPVQPKSGDLIDEKGDREDDL